MYEDNSPCKSLFFVEFKKIELTTLADSSMHGKKNILNLMKILDPERYQNFIFITCYITLSEICVLMLFFRWMSFTPFFILLFAFISLRFFIYSTLFLVQYQKTSNLPLFGAEWLLADFNHWRWDLFGLFGLFGPLWGPKPKGDLFWKFSTRSTEKQNWFFLFFSDDPSWLSTTMDQYRGVHH